MPHMLERGGGYLLQTVSAAGLLTHPQSATYAVTKHASLAFAEWLSMTYGDRGIKVSALCPQGVRTDMLRRAEAEAIRGRSFLLDSALEPEQVADEVVKGLAAERFLILPHGEVAEYVRRRAADHDRWLRGMRRLQAVMKMWTFVLAALLGRRASPARGGLRVYVIDVEGGGATLVIAPSGQSMLIDSGSPGAAAERDSQRIADAMRAAGLTKINYLFTTHYDGDHVGGAPAANAVAHFDRFFDHGEMDPKWEQNRGIEERYAAYLAHRRRQADDRQRPATRSRWRGARRRRRVERRRAEPADQRRRRAQPVLQGRRGQGAEQDRELAVHRRARSRIAGFTFLDVGDLTWDKEMDLACPVNKLGRVSLMLATHHGFFNDQSGAPALLWAIQPQVVIANNGPRKGLAAPPTSGSKYARDRGLEGLWQSHLAVANDKAHNTGDEMIANVEPSAECKGHWIRVDVGSERRLRRDQRPQQFQQVLQGAGKT